eukprot:g446.t1
MPDTHHELAPWRPTGITPLCAVELPEDQRERARRAIGEQCMNARDIYGRTQAAVGAGARSEQWQMDQRRAALQHALAASQREALPHPEERFQDPAEEPHPLGKAKASIVRHYWCLGRALHQLAETVAGKLRI